jgi:hypothetical protein
MLPLQRRKLRNDDFGTIAQRQVAADEIGIDVREMHRTAVENPRRVQMKEDGAAADERLDVSPELGGIVLRQRREQLPLAPCPFQQRARRRRATADRRRRERPGSTQGVAGVCG